jgi:hypothetical protein
MNLSEELKYLATLLDNKLMSKQSIGERLATLAQREANFSYYRINEMVESFRPLRLYGCDCQVQGCTYPEFRQRHQHAVILAGSKEPFLPWSHLENMKLDKERLEKRKAEAKRRAHEEYEKASLAVWTRLHKQLKRAEELK